MLLAGAPITAGAPTTAYGIYLAADQWDTDSSLPVGEGQGVRGHAEPITAERAGLTLLFDDPDLVDAEPVAVYARQSRFWSKEPPAPPPEAPAVDLRLADGTNYRGPAGTIFNSALYVQQVGDLPGQQTDVGQGPIFDRPPTNSLHTMRIYAARRDRFDDPVKPRLAGAWELLVDAPATGDSASALLPAGVPTVLAGFDTAGRVVRWTSAAKDSDGRQATFYAFAGDHYSAVRPLGKHFCIGCHPGHSSLGRADHRHAEQSK